MVFDQNSAPKDVRPLNVARTIAEEPRIAPAAATGRNIEGFYPNPPREAGNPLSIPVYYPPGTVSDAGFVGLGYGNGAATPGVAMWGPRMPVPLGHPGVSPTTGVGMGLGYNPNLGNRVGGNAADLASTVVATGTGYGVNLGNRVGGNTADLPGTAAGTVYGVSFGNRVGVNAADIASCAMATGIGYHVNLGNQVGGNTADHGGNGVDQAGSDMATGLGYSPNLGNRVSGNVTDKAGNNLGTGFTNSPNLGNRVVGGGTGQVSDEGGDDSVSGKKVKILCSFGGKILPRPSDGMLRYVGGQTRIIGVKRDVSFNELAQKMVDTYGQPVIIKYQLPDEDLDALVSVSCPDDLDNMMDEYDKLVERSSDGSAKLRLFLFSVSELDPLGTVQFGDLNNSGQRYFDVVNGIMDGVGGGVMKKGSMASASSTQNSDYSGNDAFDSLGPGQGDASGLSSASMLSPRGNSATSNDTATRMVCVDPSPATYADTSAAPPGIPIMSSALLQTSQPEVQLESSVPVTVTQPQLGLQQSRMDIPTSSPYMQAYADPRQEVMKHADYLQFPPQMGFPNPHLLGTAGSVFTQQQLHDNSAGITSHQFIPAVHMTMTPASSHFSIRPNMVQPVMQPQQTRLDHYADESKFGPGVVQLPVDQSYNSYQVHVPSSVVGGGYGWHQVPVPERVILSDGLVPHQQVRFPEKIPRLDDCYMCQKALPHTHSDTLVQDQRDSSSSLMSDVNSICHSLHGEDKLKGQPMKRVIVTGALGEGIIEQKAVPQPRVLGQVDSQVWTPQMDITRFTQSPETQIENEMTVLQNEIDLDRLRISAPPGVISRTSDIQSSHAAFMTIAPHSYQDDAVQQPSVPGQYQVKKDALMNNSDVSPVGGVSTQISECVVHESPKEYSKKLPGNLPREDTADTFFPHEQLRPVDGRMDTLGMPSHETYINENRKSNLDKIRKEENFDKKPQLVAGKEVLLDNTFGKPKAVFDTVCNKPIDGLPCPSTDAPHVNNSRPLESYEMSKPPIWVNPVSYSQSNIGFRNLNPEETCFGGPALLGVESSHPTERIPAPAEWKEDTLQFQTKMVPGDTEAVPSNSNVQDSSNSLFSNQDPWSLRHDTYFPPPRPNKVPLIKEALATRDPLGGNHLGSGGGPNAEVQLEVGVHQPLGIPNRDLHLEQVRSAKGSAEEQIKQDLQTVAEDVAASVLHSASPSNSDLHDRIESAFETYPEGDIQNSCGDKQDKAKDDKNKLSDKTNLGFPVSDGIGRLQIILNSDLEELRELGSGTFGTVYHGKWRGTDVAIKRINDRCFAGKPSEQERMRDDFWNEAIKLADLHHPNVLAFYGVVLDGPGGSVATVTEYMVNGSLRNASQKNEKSLDKRKCVLIAMDVAFGMEYLHGKNIVHFDLKSDNLLVNLRDPDRPICKVGDLGLSKVKCQTLISGGVRGTLPWMAPELLNGSSSLVSEKVDVFSFGIVMWELLTGEEPYADLHYGAIIGGIVSNTLRPPIPESCGPEWGSLMQRCWSSEPSERPSFTEIAKELRAMAAKLPPKAQNQPQQLPSTQLQVQK
ncbi:hypothetical protein I3843_15G157300 [Carya illinoinensis]|nr:hypothetical protein I3843_15G157300 [Carya illinoinensis]